MSESTILDKGASAITALSNLFVWDKNTDDNLSSLVSDERMIALGDALQGVLKDSTVKIPQIITYYFFLSYLPVVFLSNIHQDLV